MMRKYKLQKKTDYLWMIKKEAPMNVPAYIYTSERLLNQVMESVKNKEDKWDALLQLKNVASLPGIYRYALAMADMHPGYGFPIGGVAAMDIKEGLICIGGVGFDCNCGVRALIIDIPFKMIEKKKEELAEMLYKTVPAGLGKKSKNIYSHKELNKILKHGAKYIIAQGFGVDNDLNFMENNGCMEEAEPQYVSDYAKHRQLAEMGTLGSGNHYLEIQQIYEIFDIEKAKKMGINPEGAIVFIHTGSRALGHQIGTDYLKIFRKAVYRYNIDLPDMELVGLPFYSHEAQQYYRAICSAMNCAFANRQIITHLVRKVFKKIFKCSNKEIRTLYDVGHNNAKIEKYKINRETKTLIVHRKGSTRNLPPNHNDLPSEYKEIGQPVLVGGSMGTYSYILLPTENAIETFYSTIHGAGRIKSRRSVKKEHSRDEIFNELKNKNIILKAASKKGVLEEAPDAYKDIDEVIDVMVNAGINEKIVKLKPIICIKG